MHIEHAAVWTADIDRLARFYETYFQGRRGEIYSNPAKQFQSCFLTFPKGARLELMHQPGRLQPAMGDLTTGLTHLAFSAGSIEAVNELTERMRAEGVVVTSGPRWTGDGYYESTVLDPDGNSVEITV